MQKKYQLTNNILGWVIFAIAAFVYCSTIEPTASFWDCPEFITTGYKLEIGHPPGAPFFMLTANLFSHFASDPTQVAKWVNTMSALLSATTILFLFWTITHLTRKLVLKDWDDLTPAKIVAIMGSGAVGALIYTFSDTFWFSAVEGEVYAYSSAFTAVVFWLILKWEDHADEPHSDRWLVLIMYMTGLSIGVHLLNLLCIPAIVLVFCYKKFPNIEVKGSIFALLISFAVVAAVLYGVVPGIITVGGWFEWFFVNDLGCPFNTGEIVYIFLLVASVCWAIYETYTNKSLKRQNIAFLIAFAMLGIPFYGYGWSAVAIGIIIIALVAVFLFLNRKKDKKVIPLISARVKNTALLCMLMLMIGYSSYALIVIRSSANPPMDQNSPEDIFTLGSYLSRDQYGDRPLLYGQAYTSEPKFNIEGNNCYVDRTEGAPIYQRKEKASADEPDQYFVVSHKFSYNYAQNMLFPRMYDGAHTKDYCSWMGWTDGNGNPVPQGTEIPYDRCGEDMTVVMPTQFDNIFFFLSYQCNFMYWRYFMWNFAGRQNDIKGDGEVENGNWITGIPVIDNARLGDQDKLPDVLKENKGHNVYYCLPLLLGLIGLFWQAYRGKRGIRQFWVVFFLFFMTGLAIVIYLNQTPNQPRERDYAYAGSFYAFAIWCGIGVAALCDHIQQNWLAWIKQNLKKLLRWAMIVLFAAVIFIMVMQIRQSITPNYLTDCLALLSGLVVILAASLTVYSIFIIILQFVHKYVLSSKSIPAVSMISILTLLVPIQMASQNWDDHDRSGRRTCTEFGQNYLMTLQDKGNPIIFTNGDNDTFPLWYNQETEGFRTDTRVCNLSYLQTDWYIDQMTRPAYDSPSLPITWSRLEYCSGTNESVEVRPELKTEIMQFVKDNPAEAKKQFGEEPFELKNILDHWVRHPEKYGLSHVIPTDTVYVTIDKDAVRKSGMLMASDTIPDKMVISLSGKRTLYKSDLMMLELIAHANWTRPIYVAMTVGEDNYMNLGDNFIQEGLANRISPFTTKKEGVKNFDTEKTYKNMMERYKYGGMSTPGVYIDETVMRMCITHRRLFGQLALNLILEGKKDKALKALDRAMMELPEYNIPLDYTSAGDIAKAYALLGQKKKAMHVIDAMWKNASQYAEYYNSLDDRNFKMSEMDCYRQIYIMKFILDIADITDHKYEQKLEDQLGKIAEAYQSKGGRIFQ